MLLNMLRMTFRTLVCFIFVFYHRFFPLAPFNLCALSPIFRPVYSHAPHYQLKFLQKQHQQLFLSDLHIWKSQSLNRETRVTLFTSVDTRFQYTLFFPFSFRSLLDLTLTGAAERCVCVRVCFCFCTTHSLLLSILFKHSIGIRGAWDRRSSKQLTKTYSASHKNQCTTSSS